MSRSTRDAPRGLVQPNSFSPFFGVLLLIPVLLMTGLMCDGMPAPAVNDTDGDGFGDDEETSGNPPTDPFDPDDKPDHVLDADGDGFSDYQEVNGTPATDPFDPTDNPDNVRDSDADGCSDFEEVWLGLCDGDPNTGSSPSEPNGAVEAVTVSGSITVGANLIVDGDTNDPTNPVRENNAVDSTRAQAVPNPGTVGGFLGRIGPEDDVRDVYRVQMATGQTATLLLADPVANDFDLFLYDDAGDPLDSSEGVGKTEQVTAPDNGTFLVEVYGSSVDRQQDTGGLYSLLIGEHTLTPSICRQPRERLSSLDDFAEGEVLVKYVKGTRRGARARLHDELGLEVLSTGEHSGGFQRLKLRPVASVAEARPGPGRADRVAPGRGPSPTIATLKDLRRRPDVQYAQPNYIRRALAVPDDEFYPDQWAYPLMSLPQAWDITTGNADVIVAVMDTGVALWSDGSCPDGACPHPDLEGQLVGGYDFVSDSELALDGDGIDPDPADPGDSEGPGIASTFHGTHVAGIIAARTNNGTGVAGVAWNTRIMPVRALGRAGAGTDYDIAQGIRFAAGLSNDSGTTAEARADVINLSLGGPGSSSVLENAVTAAHQAGVILIAAAGNENSDADDTFPAALAEVVSVSAVGLTRERAPYSNSGSTVAVAAPGGNMEGDADGDGLADGILSTVGTDADGFDYALYEGTSMSAPHVAGVVALMKAVHPDLTPSDVDQLLAGTHPGTTLSITDDIGPSGRDEFFGHGLINALSAVRAASEIVGVAASQAPVLQVVPRHLSFGSDLTSLEVEVTNGGGGTLAVSSISASETWIYINPPQGGEGTYTVTVDRSGLADGVYSGSVQFVSNGGDLAVAVRMYVGMLQASGGDVGTLYVLLVDPDTLDTIAQDETDASRGYAFSFSDVPAGAYRLYAGTDMDDNLYINDEGEAFGAYPVASQTEMLDATEGLSGLSFSVSFLVNIPDPSSTSHAASLSASGPRLLRRPTPP